jgi:plastocyanin
MPRRAVPVATVLVVAMTLLSASAHADNPTLTGIVGTNDAFNITLNDSSGQKIRQLTPGTYTVVVDDRSRIHNFHLASNSDPAVDFRTELEFVGQQSFTVTFKDHTRYAYACEPHWQVMNGEFFVQSAAAPSPTPTPKPRVRALRASVSASATVRLSSSSVRAGAYRILVNDRSRAANFHLAGRGLDRRTGVQFRGASTWNVRLVRGTYRYGSDPAGLTKRLRVR